jgi:O-antigen ligase
MIINSPLLFLVSALLLIGYLAYKNHSSATVLLIALLPTYLLRLYIFRLPTNFFELAVTAVALVGFMQPSVRATWQRSSSRLPRLFYFLVLVFVLSTIISTYVSPHLLTSLGILKSWVIIPLIFGWLIFSVGQSLVNRSKITFSLVASGTFIALFSLIQLNPLSLSRLKGPYDVPNSLALFLAPIFILAFFSLRSPLSLLSRYFNYTSLIIIGLTIIATQSFSAILAITFVLIISLLIHSSQRGKIISVLLLIFLLSSLFFFYTGRFPYLLSPLTSNQPNSTSVRWQLWSVSVDLIKANFFLGTGLGTFEPAYQQGLHQRWQKFENCKLKTQNCFQPLPEFVYRDPHNWILSFWLNTGLLGLLSFAGLHIIIFWPLFKLRITSYGLRVTDYKPPPPALALLTLLIFGLFDTIYWKNDLSALHWGLISLILSSLPQGDADEVGVGVGVVPKEVKP